MHPVPNAMRQNGRTIDQNFADDEMLYYRIPPAYFQKNFRGQNKILDNAFNLPDLSVNRSKHGGRDEYVRHFAFDSACTCKGYNHTDAIAAISVRNASEIKGLQAQGNRILTRVSHVPFACNYYHSEIQATTESGAHITKSEFESWGWPVFQTWRRALKKHFNENIVRRVGD